MRFEFYSDAIADVPKLSVDGTVDKAIHFSHWHGNRTPQSVKADTSTETVLNVVSAANRAELASPVARRIALRAGRPIAQVVFRYCQAVGILPLTGTSQFEHMRLDLDAGEFELAADEISALETLLTN